MMAGSQEYLRGRNKDIGDGLMPAEEKSRASLCWRQFGDMDLNYGFR